MFINVDEIIFTIVNTEKLCHKRDKAYGKAFTSQSIWEANVLVTEPKKLFD